MSQISSQFGLVPGMGTVVETFESAITWGPFPPRYWKNAYISSAAVDSGNVPTTTLRMGLVMGKITSSGQWTNYSPTATDGSQVAQGVLAENLRLADVLTGLPVARFYAILASGGVQASKLLGLDGMARAQMRNFIFDDNIAGAGQFPWQNFLTKTADYTILSTDNLTHFDTLGATGTVVFTLPTIASGLCFGFTCAAGFTMTVASAEGDNIIAFNDASADSLSFQTGSAEIGGSLKFYSNPAATKWFVENVSAGANTITIAT